LLTSKEEKKCAIWCIAFLKPSSYPQSKLFDAQPFQLLARQPPPEKTTTWIWIPSVGP